MVPLPPQEKSRVIKKNASLNANKLRFEINTVELPIGIQGDFGIVLHPGASLAVPITDDGKVIILRQYRFAIARRLLEFPAGTLETGEDPLEAMKRELGEESGYKATQWDSLGEMVPCPAYSDEVINIYLARGLSPLEEKPLGDVDEDIEVLLMEKEELNHCISSGEEALDGKSITAWFRACQFLNFECN